MTAPPKSPAADGERPLNDAQRFAPQSSGLPTTAGEFFRLAVLAIARESASSTVVSEEMKILEPSLARGFAQIVLDAVAVDKEGPGRPPVFDADALSRIKNAVAQGVPRSTAIAAEATRLARSGGSQLAHAQRLRRKLREER